MFDRWGTREKDHSVVRNWCSTYYCAFAVVYFLQRESFVSTDEAYVAAITSIWGLDTHDANSVSKSNRSLQQEWEYLSLKRVYIWLSSLSPLNCDGWEWCFLDYLFQYLTQHAAAASSGHWLYSRCGKCEWKRNFAEDRLVCWEGPYNCELFQRRCFSTCAYMWLRYGLI